MRENLKQTNVRFVRTSILCVYKWKLVLTMDAIPVRGNVLTRSWRRLSLGMRRSRTVATLLGLSSLIVLLHHPHAFPRSLLRPTPEWSFTDSLQVREMYTPGYTTAHAGLCPGLGSRTRLLILVSSAPAHASARDAVRRTWGHAALRNDITLAFVLGIASEKLNEELDQEDLLYGDLIRGNFRDSYSHLTLKTLSLFQWAVTYCPRAPRILKTDDDMFINVPRLLRFISSHDFARRTIWGDLVRNAEPDTNPGHKHFVPYQEYPGDKFPDFVSGAAYLLTSDTAKVLVPAAINASFMRLDDVLFTGTLARNLNITLINSSEFYNYHNKYSDYSCSLQRRVIGVHTTRAREQFELWRKLHDTRTNCGPNYATEDYNETEGDWQCCDEEVTNVDVTPDTVV